MWCFDLHHSLGSTGNTAANATGAAHTQSELYTGSTDATTCGTGNTGNTYIYASTQTADSGLYAVTKHRAICCSDCISAAATSCTTKAARGLLSAANAKRSSSTAATNSQLCPKHS
jgi:hypothetical protein